MSLAALIELSKLGGLEKVDPDGRKYHSKKIEGASKGHWLCNYTYKEQWGHSETTFWERMSNRQMRMTQCFADDYTGDRTRPND